MDESYFKERISGYFDNNLPPDEHQLVEDFLQNSEEGRRMLEELGRLDEFVARHSDLSGSDDIWEARASKIEAALGFLEEPEPVVTDIVRPRWSWLGWRGAALAASAALLVFIGINQTDIFDTDQISVPPPAVTPQATPQAESGDIVVDIDGADYQPSVDSGVSKGPASTRAKVQAPVVGIPMPVGDDEVPVVSREETPPPPAPSRASAASTQTAKKQSPIPPSDKDEPEIAVEDEMTETGNLAHETKVKGSSLDLSATKPESERGAARATTQSFQLAPRQDVSDLSKSIEVAGESIEQRPLSYWRERRDSLKKALESSTYTDIAPKSRELLGYSLVKPDKEAERRKAAKPQADLLEAYYNIALLSDDEAERLAAVDYLEAVAADSTSVNQTLSRRYLNTVKKR